LEKQNGSLRANPPKPTIMEEGMSPGEEGNQNSSEILNVSSNGDLMIISVCPDGKFVKIFNQGSEVNITMIEYSFVISCNTCEH